MNPLSINQAFIAELARETENTRKLFERISVDKYDFKIHPKSFSIAETINHLIDTITWIPITLEFYFWDMSQKTSKITPVTSVKSTLSQFDKAVEDAIAAFENFNESKYSDLWQLKMDETVIFEAPKAAVIRSMIFNHFIHHRGQLDVYARVNNVPLPQFYGPTADEK